MSKRHNTLPRRASFFISSAGKIENVQEFEIKLFEQLLHSRWQPCKNCMVTCSCFQRAWYFAFSAINCGVPHGSVLGPLLCLLYINDLNQAIKFCKVHHFADDINLLCLSNSIKKLNKLVNADLKHLVNWLNANKISLNVKKTEMVIFKSKQKKLEVDLK